MKSTSIPFILPFVLALACAPGARPSDSLFGFAPASDDLIRVHTGREQQVPAFQDLKSEIRAREVVVVVNGGAGGMSPEVQAKVSELFREMVREFDRRGIQAAGITGGTRSGVMQAFGEAVGAHGNGRWVLAGVSPARETYDPRSWRHGTPEAHRKTPLETHHRSVIVRGDRPAPGEYAWGVERESMFRLAPWGRGVAVIVNGGGLTLDEVRSNLHQRRPILVLEGTGRAADALAGVLRGAAPPEDPAARTLHLRAREILEGYPRARVGLLDVRAPGAQSSTALAERVLELAEGRGETRTYLDAVRDRPLGPRVMREMMAEVKSSQESYWKAWAFDRVEHNREMGRVHQAENILARTLEEALRRGERPSLATLEAKLAEPFEPLRLREDPVRRVFSNSFRRVPRSEVFRSVRQDVRRLARARR